MTKLKELTIKLPENWVEHLQYLEKTTPQNVDYYIREALFRYLEDLEDYEAAFQALENASGITYTSEEVTQKLKERWEAKKANL